MTKKCFSFQIFTCFEMGLSLKREEVWSFPLRYFRSANQGFPHLLRNPKIHYRAEESPSLVAVLV
jgi:hypothetical protein